MPVRASSKSVERGKSARSQQPESRTGGADHIGGDRVLRALPIENQPTLLGGLAAITFAHPTEQRQILLVPITIDRLPLYGRVWSDIEHDRQGRRRQIFLHVDQPCRIEAEGLAVGDARRQIAIAHENQAAIKPPFEIVLALV